MGSSKKIGPAKQIQFGMLELPQEVLETLYLEEGDTISFHLRDGEVFLRRELGDSPPHDEELPHEESYVESSSQNPFADLLEGVIDKMQSGGLDPGKMLGSLIKSLGKTMQSLTQPYPETENEQDYPEDYTDEDEEFEELDDGEEDEDEDRHQINIEDD